MSGDDGEQMKKPAFDLEERTAQFGEAVIRFAKTISKNPVTTPLISQLVRRAQVWAQIIARRTTRFPRRISKIKSALAGRSPVKRNFGCA
jgi:hypothetical protein